MGDTTDASKDAVYTSEKAAYSTDGEMDLDPNFDGTREDHLNMMRMGKKQELRVSPSGQQDVRSYDAD